MIGKHIGSLEGRAAEIEYDRFSHSLSSEEYGKHIAELILKQSYGVEDYSEQIPSEYIIWQDNEYALLLDKSELIFDLFKISNNANESKNMNKKRKVRLTESDLYRIVKESVNKVLKEEKPPFIDSELAMGNHDNAAFHRFNLVLDNFAKDLIGWIKDEGYEDKIDMGFMAKVMQTIREVLSEYGLPTK